MIEIVSGSMFDRQHDFLVNTVNCEGHPGRGLAKQFAERYPEATALYRLDCRDNRYHPGGTRLYVEGGQHLIFVATKGLWRNQSQYVWIEMISRKIHRNLLKYAHDWEHPVSIAIPPMGAGLGRLDPDKIRLIVERDFASVPEILVSYYGGNS